MNRVREIEIPQDQNPALAGTRKTVYALDERGRYTALPSTGWVVEAVVTGQAEFHMHDRRLEVSTFAAAMGL